jgi:hypothetical protein
MTRPETTLETTTRHTSALGLVPAAQVAKPNNKRFHVNNDASYEHVKTCPDTKNCRITLGHQIEPITATAGV